MNKIGVHALTFIGDIENPSIEKCLSQVAKIGYDVMELPLLNPDALDVKSFDLPKAPDFKPSSFNVPDFNKPSIENNYSSFEPDKFKSDINKIDPID